MRAKLNQACQIGFFYHEIPQECRPLIDHAISLGNEFYKNDKYTELHLDGVSGFHDRHEYQVESLYLEKKHWAEKMTPELAELAEKMRALGVKILRSTLLHCGVAENDWERASGGVTGDKGQTHFTFNHYRKDKQMTGLAAHRDFGQITVLFINSRGLQARVNNAWVDVMPLQNHFVINFGRALETLVNDPKKLVAAWHQVPQVSKDRISFGTFADNANESSIFTTEEGELKDTGQSYEEYLTSSFSQYYEPETV